MGNFLSFFTSARFFIAAIGVLAVLLVGSGWALKSTIESKGHVEAELKAAQADIKVLSDNVVKQSKSRERLAKDVIKHLAARNTTQRKLDAIEKKHLNQIEVNDKLQAANEYQANLLRQKERSDGQPIKTFDTRGLR